MVPLFLCSVAIWAVCVERFWALRRWSERNREFLLSFTNLWIRGEKESAKKLCERADQVDLAHIAHELFSISNRTRSFDNKLLSRVERKRLAQSSELRRFLWILGTIGSAAPFIGLFGTVVGIIRAFESMSQTGAGGFTVVAAGISEALVATAAGILVAVLAVFFYNYFQIRVGKHQFQLKLLTEEMLDQCEQEA